jgi:PAS domain S-box-containing protein
VNHLFSPRARPALFRALLTPLFFAILAIDLLLPFGYIAAALYVIPVFLTVLTGHVAWVVRTTIAAVVATLLGFLNWPDSVVGTEVSGDYFTRASIALMILAAGAVGAMLIVRSNRLTAVSSELSLTSVELAKQAQLARAASQIGKVAGWSLDGEEGSPIVWSDEVERLFGMSPEQRTHGDGMLALIDDERDRDQFLAAARTCLTAGTPFVETFQATCDDGRHMWVTVMGEATRNNLNHIVGLAGVLQDVTLWKEAEATAAAQQQRFAQFANSLPSIIWTADAEGAVDYFNDAVEAYTGMSKEDLLANQWVSALHPADVEDTLGEWQRALATGELYRTAYRLRRADGEYRWFRITAQSERGDDGNVVRWWGNATDVHEYHLLEMEARALAKERDDILESIGDGVYALDSEFRFTYLNANAEAMLRRPATELLGEVFWEAFPERRGSEVEEAFTLARATDAAQRFTTYNPVLEAWFDVNVTSTPQGFTVFIRDITQLKSMAEQLAQAQRMESVGRLTGGIAHDFNNLLTVVVGGAEALQEEPGLTDESREMLGLVARAAARGAELTHQLLAFSRQQPLAPQVVDVSARIREMEPILSRAIGHGITEVARLEEDLPAALVDPGQLENAVLNLAINARDAMPSGGTLTISTEFAHLDESYSTADTEVLPGDYVLVSVSDTGTGISSEQLPHIFEPFFTTKPVGEGSGLGLSMVWGFAKQTGGHVTVYSEEGIGSTFHLYLPVAPSDSRPAYVAPPEAWEGSRASGHILLAEDNPLVRDFAADRLRDHGYTVTVASTGVEALELLDGIEDLTLLLTDVIMVGGVSGRELADEVVARRPGTPVLFASGYGEDVIMHQGRLDPGVALLAKPYTGTQLLGKIHAVIDARARGTDS